MIRLHIPGIPHTIVNSKYSHCAFTGKVQRFIPMMKSVGYEVYFYGTQTSETNADLEINLFSLEEFYKMYQQSYLYLYPTFTEEQIQEKMSDKKAFVGELANTETPIYKEFNNRFRKELLRNYRSTSTDIVCLPFGKGHLGAIQGLNVVAVETGIGYSDGFLDFRIFESYTWMSNHHAKLNKKIANYWFVCPNYYNILDWDFNFNPIKNRIGFLGRVCDVKGLWIIYEVAKKMQDIEFIVCGQGDISHIPKLKNLFYKEPIHGKERSQFLGNLTALLAPSQFQEPFCGVCVEAQLCGTPVITSDHGAFSENVEPFKSGMRCHTLSDFCYGVQFAIENNFDRHYIRERAVKLFDMYKVAKKYDYAFSSIIDVYNGNNGWYSDNCHIAKLQNLYD